MHVDRVNVRMSYKSVQYVPLRSIFFNSSLLARESATVRAASVSSSQNPKFNSFPMEDK